jgi:hypothetical protein
MISSQEKLANATVNAERLLTNNLVERLTSEESLSQFKT